MVAFKEIDELRNPAADGRCRPPSSVDVCTSNTVQRSPGPCGWPVRA